MSQTKYLDLTDLTQEVLKIKVNVGENVREFTIVDPTVSAVIASQLVKEEIEEMQKKSGGNLDMKKTHEVQSKLVHAILCNDNEVTIEEVRKIPFAALTRIINAVTKHVDDAFLDEKSPSKRTRKERETTDTPSSDTASGSPT